MTNPATGGGSESESQAYARQLAILNQITRIATLDHALKPMLQRITDALASSFGWPFVDCALVDEKLGVFECAALSSTLPTAMRLGYRRLLGSGVVGEVAATERPILIDDVQAHANYVAITPGARSELCVPVKHAGRLVAVLNLESTELGAFHDQLPLLEAVADQVAGAIASARLYQELERRARLMELMTEVTRIALDAGDLQALLPRVVEYVHARSSVAFVAVFLVDAAGAAFRLAAHAGAPIDVACGTRWPVTSGIVGRGFVTGASQFVPDVRRDPAYLPMRGDIVSQLVVPIRFREHVLGAFDFEASQPDALPPEEQAVFRNLADQVAGAVHLAATNQRLLDLTRRLEQANQALQRLSQRDALTGVPNRRHWDEMLDVEWRRAYRANTELSLAIVDIDHFKAYNDAHGHPAGDACLVEVAALLRGGLHRAGELLARYGGEEFAVLLPSSTLERTQRHAEALRLRVESAAIPHGAGAAGPIVTISVGVASARPRAGGTLAQLLEATDRALYQAKRDGRNCVRAAAD